MCTTFCVVALREPDAFYSKHQLNENVCDDFKQEHIEFINTEKVVIE